MANTREVPTEKWASTFQQISQAYQNYPIRIEVENASFGQQEIGEHLNFQMLSYGMKGSDRGEMTIGVEGPFEHRIAEPLHVWVEEGLGGRIECLEIEDVQKTRTRIYFEAWPMLRAEESPPLVP